MKNKMGLIYGVTFIAGLIFYLIEWIINKESMLPYGNAYSLMFIGVGLVVYIVVLY